MGSNIEGQLGIGDRKVMERTAPVLVENIGIGNPVQVAAGSYHSTCIMNNGELYTWGRGSHGCLGIGTDEAQFLPMLVQFDEPKHSIITSVSAGGEHTVCMDQGGRIYTFGRNSKPHFNNHRLWAVGHRQN